jgi:ribonucleoside-diphosphate reductase beta chain
MINKNMASVEETKIMDMELETDYPLIIRDRKDRFSIFPLEPKHKVFWDFYQEGLETMWMVSEVSMMDDVVQWKYNLNDKQRHFLKYVLSFFAGSDKIVAENVSINFADEIDVMEAQFFYRHQAMMEDIHSHMYSILIDTYISDVNEREEINNAISTMPVITQKQNWAKKFSDRSKASFPERLVAFAVVEGVFFSASFAAIFYFKSMGLLPGLCKSNDFISKDEGLHCRFACKLYNYCKERLSEEQVYSIFEEAVGIESEFVKTALPVSLINLNTDDMVQYIKYVADYWLKELGYKPLYNVSNPLDFMRTTGMMRMTNFFESKEDSYQTYIKHSDSDFDLSVAF